MNKETSKYVAMGRAALVPGMAYMIEQMQRLLNDLRSQVNEVTREEDPKALRAPKPKRNGRGWPADPAERKKEAARRRAKGRANLTRLAKAS